MYIKIIHTIIRHYFFNGDLNSDRCRAAGRARGGASTWKASLFNSRVNNRSVLCT